MAENFDRTLDAINLEAELDEAQGIHDGNTPQVEQFDETDDVAETPDEIISSSTDQAPPEENVDLGEEDEQEEDDLEEGDDEQEEGDEIEEEIFEDFDEEEPAPGNIKVVIPPPPSIPRPKIPSVQAKPMAAPTAPTAKFTPTGPATVVAPRIPIAPSGIKITVPKATAAPRAKRAATTKTFQFPDESGIGLESLLQRESGEDAASYEFREHYTWVLDSLPSPWGDLNPSSKVALGFMATKRLRYNVKYDPALEATLDEIARLMEQQN